VDPWDDAPDWFWDLRKTANIWVAHNIFFEISIWENVITPRFGVPHPNLSQWQDTKSIALSWSLPGSLAGASAILGREEKDKEGHKLMLKMCKPRKPSKKNPAKYHWTPEDFERLVQYCEQDVVATNAILQDLGTLQKCERPIFEIDKKMNQRGFCVDIELIDSAVVMARGLLEDAKKELLNITGGFIQTPNQHARFKQFALSHGVRMQSTDKAAVTEILKREDLPPIVRKVLEIRQLLGLSSVAKYEKAAALVDRGDNRIRDAFVFHKASTGRWAGQGFQPQNLTRGTLDLKGDDLENAIVAVKRQDTNYLKGRYDSPMQVLSDLIRSSIVADEDKKFVAADFASVEARGVLWLAGETEAVEMMQSGVEIYKEMASAIFGKPISEISAIERFVGKTAILGLGYGMGVERFMEQTNADALKYGFDIQIDMLLAQKVVDTYRSKYSGVPKLWRALETAFKNAIITGRPHTAYGITYYRKKPRVIACRLLSGREIHYWDCRIDQGNGITYSTVSGTSGKWTRTSTWGGKILENDMQGICSDLLRYSMVHIDNQSKWDISMTVHDEIVCETPDTSLYNAGQMTDEITKLPPWAKGFPLEAKGWEGKRFRK
jgi:DNA polymerase